MLCIKCKKEIEDDVLRCPHCGIKVNMHCPECNTLNRFGTKYCIECGSELLKVCLKCGSNNLYYATKCRKCNSPLEIQTEEEVIAEVPQTAEIKEIEAIKEVLIPADNKENEEISEGSQEEKKHNPHSLRDFLNSQAQKKEVEVPQEQSKIDYIDMNLVTQAQKEKEADISQQIQEKNEEKSNPKEVVFVKNSSEKEKIDSVKEISNTENKQQSANVNLPPKRRNNKIQSCIMKTPHLSQNRQVRNQNIGKKPNINALPEINNYSEQGTLREQKNIEPDIKVPPVKQSPDLRQEPELKVQTAVNEVRQEEKKNLTSDDNNDFLIDLKKSETKINSSFEESQVEETEFTPTKTEIDIPANMEESSFDIAKQSIVNSIVNPPQKSVVAITGDKGAGKSILLKQVIADLAEKYSVIPFYARCSDTTQVSCLGAFQDAFLNLLGLSGFTSKDINLFIKSNKEALKQEFKNFAESELELIDFVNFLYPEKNDIFDNIYANKRRLFNIINKMLRQLTDKSDYFVIAIDNFDYIDALSYELLTRLASDESINSKIKILLTYEEDKAVESYFSSASVNSETAKTVHLEALTQDNSKKFALQYINNDSKLLSERLWQNIYSASGNNPLKIEQLFALLYEKGIILYDNSKLAVSEESIVSALPSTIEAIIKERLNLLMPQLKSVLFTAAILGYRFDNQVLAECLKISDENLNPMLVQLNNILYIEELTNYSSTFKSFTVWKIIEQAAKESSEYKSISESIIKTYSKIAVSSPMDVISKFEDCFETEELLQRLKNVSNIIAYLGDSNLYVVAKKLQLKLLNTNPEITTEEDINIICEEIGKLCSQSVPFEAINYLSNAIDYAQKTNNTTKVIELCGYLVNCCYSTGNYYGVVEAVDLVIKNTGDEIGKLELALIKERKLKALYNLGNGEEIIELMNDEICITIQDAILDGLKDESIRNLAINAWIESNIILAGAYSMQGSPLALEVISDIKNFIPTLSDNVQYFKTKTALVEAFAASSLGDLNNSEKILNQIISENEIAEKDVDLLSEWNLLNLINKVLSDIAVSKEELFELAAFSNNTNEYFAKNIIKLILGYIIQKEGNTQKALEIYNEQITYFAKEKNAIGALLSWYLIAQATLIVEDASKALDIASKALEVAQGPKINNFHFIIYFKKFIAEVYMIKGDLESAKMYFEQAMALALENGLNYALFKLQAGYSNYLEKCIQTVNSEEEKTAHVQELKQVQQEALETAQKLNLENLIREAKGIQATFDTFCKLNNINL